MNTYIRILTLDNREDWILKSKVKNWTKGLNPDGTTIDVVETVDGTEIMGTKLHSVDSQFPNIQSLQDWIDNP